MKIYNSQEPGFRCVSEADHAAEVERLQERVRVLEEALRNIVAHEVDYMTRNHLGDPEKQSYIIQALAAIRAQKEGK